MKALPRLSAVGWRGWCLLGLASVIGLGGVLWRQHSEEQLGPILSLERQRREVLAFLRLAIGEAVSGEGNSALANFAAMQAEAGDVPSAIETVKAVKDPFYRGMGWTTIIQRRAGDRSGGQRVLRLALQEANDAATPPGLRDDILAQVAIAQAEDGQTEEASPTARAITDPSSQITAWCAVAQAQAKGGDLAVACRSLAVATGAAYAIANNSVSNKPEDIVTAWTDVAVAQAKIGDATGRDKSFAQAIEATRAIKDTRTRADSLSGIAKERFLMGDLTGRDRTFVLAQEVAHAFSEEWNRSTRITNVAEQQALCGDVTGAMAVMKELEETDQDSVLGRQAEFQAKQTTLREALATVRTINTAGERVFALQKVAEVRGEVGDAAGQREALLLARQTARSITNGDDQENALGQVAFAQARTGNAAGAIRTLGGRWRRTLNFLDAWREIAVAQARAGDIAGARRIACRLRPGPDPWWNHWWGRFLTTIGRPRATGTDDFLLNQTASSNWKTVLCSIAAAQARTGDRRAALATMQELPAEPGNSFYWYVASELFEHPVKPATP